MLVGPKAGGQNYRPDEIALLLTSAHQLGSDLSSLRVEELERRAQTAEREATAFEQKLAASETRVNSLAEKSAAQEREAAALRHIINHGLKV